MARVTGLLSVLILVEVRLRPQEPCPRIRGIYKWLTGRPAMPCPCTWSARRRVASAVFRLGGSAMTRAGRFIRLTGAGSRAARCSQARPARATAFALNSLPSGGVRRPWRAVSPSACSAKVTHAQPGATQNRRRTVSSLHTCRPPTPPSARRWYPLCRTTDGVAQPDTAPKPTSRLRPRCATPRPLGSLAPQAPPPGGGNTVLQQLLTLGEYRPAGNGASVAP